MVLFTHWALPVYAVTIILPNWGGQELVWEIYFLSLRGSPRIYKGSRQMPWISTHSENKIQISRGPPCWLWLITWSDCSALHRWKSVKQPKRWQSHFLQFMQLVHILFFMLDFYCDAPTKVLMRFSDIRSECVQLKSCASQWCTGCNFGAYGILLARQIRAFVLNN